MSILQGNSYYMEIRMTDTKGNIITNSMVSKATFTVGSITKNDEHIVFDSSKNVWKIYLTEQETFSLNSGMVNWQMRFEFNDGTTDGNEPTLDYVKKSINKVILSDNTESEETEDA